MAAQWGLQQASSGESGRGSIHCHSHVRLEEQWGAEPVEARVDLGRLAAHAVRGDARLSQSAGPVIPTAKLANSTNLCYINRQAAYWVGALTSAPVLCYGQLQAGFRVFLACTAVRLIEVLAFRPIFRDWARVHHQHDAGEFLHQFLTATQSAPYTCRWEARTEGERPVHYSGTLEQPIVLPMAGAPPLTLQLVLDRWHMQHAVHALLEHRGLIWLQLEHYADGVGKCTTALRVRPGDQLVVPFFTEPAGLGLRHESFIVAAIVYHLGDPAVSGHYLTLIGKPNAERWEYFVCDDNRLPRKARGPDLRQVDHNAYLVGLVRGQ